MHRTPPQCLWLLLPHFPNLCCQTNSAGISHTLKCNRNMISSASPSPLTFGFVRLLFCEFLHLVLLLEGRQNIMTSLLLYIFPRPRNRFHPTTCLDCHLSLPHLFSAIHNKSLFDHKDLAAESVCLQMQIQALCPDFFLIWETTLRCWVCHCC